MANYIYRSWQTVNLPVVSGDTTYAIYTSVAETPGTTIDDLIFMGAVIDGYQLNNLNDIFAQYVTVKDLIFRPTNPLTITDNDQSKTFYVYSTTSDWADWNMDTVTVNYDWSYDTPSRVKSHNIIDLLDYRQYLVCSLMSSDQSSESFTVKLADNQLDTLTVSGDTVLTYVRPLWNENYPGEFSFAFSYDFFVYRQPSTINNGQMFTLTVGDHTYYVTNTCYKYALYWQNELGGYDYMLFGGKELQTDKLTRLSYKQRYTAQSTDFYQKDYMTTINESWSLNTSWLTDTQGQQLISLFASNRLYLQELDTHKIIPVNVTSNSLEHKTYKNQGRQLCAYTITVSASQPKYRL